MVLGGCRSFLLLVTTLVVHYSIRDDKKDNEIKESYYTHIRHETISRL